MRSPYKKINQNVFLYSFLFYKLTAVENQSISSIFTFFFFLLLLMYLTLFRLTFIRKTFQLNWITLLRWVQFLYFVTLSCYFFFLLLQLENRWFSWFIKMFLIWTEFKNKKKTSPLGNYHCIRCSKSSGNTYADSWIFHRLPSLISFYPCRGKKAREGWAEESVLFLRLFWYALLVGGNVVLGHSSIFHRRLRIVDQINYSTSREKSCSKKCRQRDGVEKEKLFMENLRRLRKNYFHFEKSP